MLFMLIRLPCSFSRPEVDSRDLDGVQDNLGYGQLVGADLVGWAVCAGHLASGALLDFRPGMRHCHTGLNEGPTCRRMNTPGQAPTSKARVLMQSLIEGFQVSLAARRLAASTQQQYASELMRFAEFLSEQGVLPGGITPHLVEQYIARNGSATPTVNRQLVVLRQFFTWLKHPAAQALAELRAPRIHRPVPDYLTPDEEARLRRTLQNRVDQRHHVRDRALICLMLDTGMRVAEAVGLSASDVDLDGKRVTLLAKGGKKRLKFLPVETRSLLRPLVNNLPGEAPVFISSHRRRLCDRQVRRIVQGWADLAGITKAVHPHSLRHTFATSLLARTGNLRLVQKALDHESPTTTAIYTHVVDAELQAAIEDRRGA